MPTADLKIARLAKEHGWVNHIPWPNERHYRRGYDSDEGIHVAYTAAGTVKWVQHLKDGLVQQTLGPHHKHKLKTIIGWLTAPEAERSTP